MKDAKHERAFPYTVLGKNSITETKVYPGMTLRDYFAGQVIVGLVVQGWNPKYSAKEAYEITDELLSVREQSK